MSDEQQKDVALSHTNIVTQRTREAVKRMREERRSPYVLASPSVVRKRLANLLWTGIKAKTVEAGPASVVDRLADISLDTGIDYPILHEIVLSAKPPKGYPNVFVTTILARHFGVTVESIMEHPKYGLQHKP